MKTMVDRVLAEVMENPHVRNKEISERLGVRQHYVAAIRNRHKCQRVPPPARAYLAIAAAFKHHPGLAEWVVDQSSKVNADPLEFVAAVLVDAMHEEQP